jgi:hypothetical protein
MWPSRPAATTPLEPNSNVCRRCGRIIEVDPALSVAALEGMHWLCFHLEFEHDVDPDVPCADTMSCPWWTIRHYEEKLSQLNVDPRDVRINLPNRGIDAITAYGSAEQPPQAASHAAVRPRIVYVDVDDTLIRSAGTKRVPMPNVIRHVRTLFEAGAELYCWSTGGALYAERAAREVGLHQCFRAFLPKPHVLIDDQPFAEWRGVEQRHPFNCHDE